MIANNLHRYDLNNVTIGSPLHGANLLNQLESILPTPIRNFFYKESYGFLKSKGRDEEPPYKYHNITMGWGFSDFDGCVYKNEAVLDQKHSTHLSWMDHRTEFANPRLWLTVLNKVNDIYSC